MDYETDALFAVSELELREKFVYLIRKFRPYAVFSFDPMGRYENNQDHIRVAEAVDEALWVSAFDKHYPDHFVEGLAPFSVCERWFFGRELPIPNHYEDVTDFIDQKVEAACCHQTMIRHMLRQYQLQLETWGRRVPLIDAAYAGDPRGLMAMFLRSRAAAVGEQGGLGEGRMGETFRLERFGALEDLFQRLSEPIPGRAPVHRPGLDHSLAD
jgi:LmbE family N-acetylglucosaminyl deacetylase